MAANHPSEADNHQHPDDCQGGYHQLVMSMGSILSHHQTSEQLYQVSQLFAAIWPGYQLVWYWRGSAMPPYQTLERECGKLSCSNILAGRIYASSAPSTVKLHQMYQWVSAAADLITAANRGRINKSDFQALADIRDLLEECEYIKAANQYVELFHHNGQCFLFRVNLHQVESMFAPDKVCRVHRSYLVNPERVSSTRKQRNGRLRLLVGEEEIPVGERYNEMLKTTYPQWFNQGQEHTLLQQWLYKDQERLRANKGKDGHGA
ncbi:LytTR family DNA-binding domain-containing protein [Ferrimonas marina]|uniref:LytTr DNA-binding domain-containing protein n=1 Tax=Ferrimonas marina TaxID=299255 RepID=A0A1M5NLG2_9GAMM|nr:LytTR family DNA-binding domain-containing protein [Ferrimonas marina]SHG90348.1 LytTr DNA-binding domain-containing protein [Ferrimonas marina]